MKNMITSTMVLIALSGCTAVTIQPLDKSLNITHICIEENPKVNISDFTGVLQDGFDRHMITSEVYRNTMPGHCEFKLTYTATRKWDLGTYMNHAELRLYKGYDKIAYAEYHLRGGGGLSLFKWAGTKSKMNPVIDELLEQYK